jgi:sarcosine oxidase
MYDAIVIGVGGMGSATLYHLARSGCKVLGLERFGIPHAFGSSHGSTRVIRLAYCEGSEYVPLLRAAYRYWRDLESVSGQAILHQTGGLDIGPEGGSTVEGSRKSCIEHGLAFEELSGSEVNERFPGYRLPSAMRAILQPDGGYLLSEVAIEAYASAALALGAEVVTDVVVRGWTQHSSAIRVDTTNGQFEARKLVVTAGAWIGKLSPALRNICRAQRQVMLWTAPLHPTQFEPGRFPVFNLQAPFGRFYGFPNHRNEGFKIGKYYHLRQNVDDPDDLDRECRPEDEAVLREGIEEYFPLANGPTRRTAVCMFTNSPDEHFILDGFPGENNVFVAAGFSGHGFKFCSVFGKVMAEFCLDCPSSSDTHRFRLTRKRTDGW